MRVRITGADLVTSMDTMTTMTTGLPDILRGQMTANRIGGSIIPARNKSTCINGIGMGSDAVALGGGQTMTLGVLIRTMK